MNIDPKTSSSKLSIVSELPEDYPSFEIVGVVMEISLDSLNTELFTKRRRNILNYINDNFDLKTLKDDRIVEQYRNFFWHHCDLDPTKTRPAGEALLRRILSKGSLPNIHPVVDAFNLISAKTRVPMCAYDYDKLNQPLTIRLSQQGDVFKGIGMKNAVQLDLGLPIICDASTTDPVVSLYPHRDADRTKLTKATNLYVITADGVPNISLDTLADTLQAAIEIIQLYCSAKIKSSFTYSINNEFNQDSKFT